MQPLCAIGPARRKTLLCDRRPDSVVHNQITMALLWNPESWSQRLAELEAQSGDLKEAPLRRDVRSLGTLLGAVLREQAGDELFAQVEALRQGTIRRRDADASGQTDEAARQDSAAMTLVHSLPVERAILLTRAFAFYFELINLAETNHRKRRRVALRLSGQAGRQRGSLEGTLSEMRRVGISGEEALNWLRRVLIVPVFTAHPTEAARRTVMFKRRRIGEFLEALDRIPLPEQDLARLEELVLAEITSLWQTDEVRSRRPTVFDEVKMGLDYYDVSIFETLPESLSRDLRGVPRGVRARNRGPRSAARPAFRLVDRRRPRRQSFCDARRDARRTSTGPRPSATPLPAPARRRSSTCSPRARSSSR